MFAAVLKNISRHIRLTPEEEAVFLSLLQHRKVRRKQYVLQEGDVCRYEFFVLKGCLRAYEVDDQGQEHIIQFAIEDWWIGNLYSFISGTPSALNIDALEDTELLQLDKASLESLYERVPKFERYFRIIIQAAWMASQQRILSNLTNSAMERYLAFIAKYPAIEQRVANHQIASYLGIKPESLSRLRKQVRQPE